MTAPVGDVLETAEGLMTREQYLHYEYLLELFRSPRDVEEDIRKLRSQARKHAIEA